ncbi:MAG: disulfide bond formation protein DsbA [Gammaproteobacteria bacterium]|nr:MAG: disulfide bond formation protein DsbA [Gammaproteobacteria bacterium]RLA49947.1 MAG: disulfide bond formation protein DsbA [Gammaproteobacteria bacterium]
MTSSIPKIIHYFDYKSPYAYLAQEEVFRLHVDTGQNVEWLPHTLDIPSFLGAAELDASGNDLIQTRNAHQWRRVKYSYMDCRREANRRGLTLRGPRKIFDSSVAHIGFLYAKQHGDFKNYHQLVFEQFWQRKLDIEDPTAIQSALQQSGIDANGFVKYLSRNGPDELRQIQQHAEASGVFGVPSYLIGDELFWGGEHIGHIRELSGLKPSGLELPGLKPPGLEQ